MNNKLYVLSTGRCGTNLLVDIFASTYPPLRIEHQSKGSRRLNIIGNLLLYFPSYQRYVKNIFYLLKKKKMPDSTVDPLLSIPLALYLINHDSNLNIFQIVHLVRDPRDFVTSFIRWKRQRTRRFFLHHFVPFWQPKPYRFEGFRRLRFRKFEHFCWIWNYKNSFFQSNFKNNSRYYLLKLEDIVDIHMGLEQAQKLFNFLGLPMNEQKIQELIRKKINPSKERGFPHWENWTQEQALILQKHCGKLMDYYGYGQELEWKKLIGVL